VRLDGAMTRLNRELSLSKFDTDPDITVFLVSLKCGGLGLNLTAASQVFMVRLSLFMSFRFLLADVIGF